MPAGSQEAEEAHEWVERYRRFWDESLNRLEAYISEVQKKKKK